ncbi:MAG: hypothetical protein WA432_03220 [Candidatus Babeliaceae bacterium]
MIQNKNKILLFWIFSLFSYTLFPMQQENPVKIITSDNKEVTLPAFMNHQSLTLKHMNEDMGIDATPIPLPLEEKSLTQLMSCFTQQGEITIEHLTQPELCAVGDAATFLNIPKLHSHIHACLTNDLLNEFLHHNVLAPSIDFLIPSSHKMSASLEKEIAHSLQQDILPKFESYDHDHTMKSDNCSFSNLSLSSDNQTITEQSGYGAHLFNISSSQEIHKRKLDHNNPLISLTINKARIKQWDSQHDGPPLTTLELPSYSNKPPVFRLAAAFSPNTKTVALGGEGLDYNFNDQDNSGIWIFDTATQKLIQKNTNTTWGQIWSLAYNPQGTHIAVGSNPDIKILDIASNKVIKTLKNNGHTAKVAFHPCISTVLAATSSLNTQNPKERYVHLWNIASEQLLQKITLQLPQKIIFPKPKNVHYRSSTLVFNRNGNILAVGCNFDAQHSKIEFFKNNPLPEAIKKEFQTATLPQTLLLSAIIKQKNSGEQNKTPFSLHTPYMMPTIYNTTIFASLSQLAQKYLIENKLVKNS